MHLGLGLGLSRRSSAGGAFDGTQGSPDAGIVAAVQWTYIGAVLTVVGQKNVTSVTRIAAGRWRIAFTNALASANYGMLGGGRLASAAGNQVIVVQPDRNTNNSGNQYSTTTLDVVTGVPNSATVLDAEIMGVVVFDPANISSSNYLAAVHYTNISNGSNGVIGSQKNVSAVTNVGTAVYEIIYTSNVPSTDYAIFGSAKFGSSTDSTFPLGVGQGANTISYDGGRLISKVPIVAGQIAATASHSFAAVGSMLARFADTSPRGTLASGSVRSDGSGVTGHTLIKGYNVSSVSVTNSGLNYRINFANALPDANYIVLTSARYPNRSDNTTLSVGANRNSSGENNYSTTSVDLVALNETSNQQAPHLLDFWVVKPWLM